MASPPPIPTRRDRSQPGRMDARIGRQHIVARRTALLVAALLVVALLGPFVAGYLTR